MRGSEYQRDLPFGGPCSEKAEKAEKGTTWAAAVRKQPKMCVKRAFPSLFRFQWSLRMSQRETSQGKQGLTSEVLGSAIPVALNYEGILL